MKLLLPINILDGKNPFKFMLVCCRAAKTQKNPKLCQNLYINILRFSFFQFCYCLFYLVFLPYLCRFIVKFLKHFLTFELDIFFISECFCFMFYYTFAKTFQPTNQPTYFHCITLDLSVYIHISVSVAK